MRRTDIDRKSSDSRLPFWTPWGIGGVIWRYLAFLVLLFLFLLLLQFLHKCSSPISDLTHLDEQLDWFDDPVNDDVDIINDREIEAPESDTWYEDDEDLNEIYEGDDPIDNRNFENPNPNLPDSDENIRRDYNPDEDVVTPEEDPYKRVVNDRLNIILNQTDEETFNRFAERFKQLYPDSDCRIDYYNPDAGLLQLNVPPSQREEIKRNLPEQINDIDFYIFDESVFATNADASKYNDPAFKSQKKSWHFAPIQAYDAWEITQGSPDIVVAVIDSYIDVSHPEFKGRIVKPYSPARRNKNVMPPREPYSFKSADPHDAILYHGTHVAALAVGALNNSTGAAGLAPNCKLMPISLGEHMSSSLILEALLYAINQGADVINLSIATLFPSEAEAIPLQEQLNYIKSMLKEQEDVWDYAFKIADQRNVTIVWCAGNCNVLAGLDETKRNSSTIRVSAVNPSLKKADFSNYGNFKSQGINFSDISAPGQEIYSAGPWNGYGFCDGTSMAAPIVSGAVALMKSVNPDLTNAQIIEILDRTGKTVDSSGYIGKLIQVRDALLACNPEMADFDEIQEDPNSIIGTWKTTELRDVIDLRTGEYTGNKTHVYLEFTSPTKGTIHYKEDNGSNYSAPFSAKISNDEIVIYQQKEATSPNDDASYVKNTIRCRRGNDGRLECHNDAENSDTFYLIRIS